MSKPATSARVAGCVVVLICAVAPVSAQTQPTPQRRESQSPPSPAAAAAAPSPAAATNATDDVDLSITANVTARELQFEVVPTPKVEFPGRPRRDTVWEAERTNLPPQVQPGVTYRDIGIRLKITSVFADIERIVAEALGEIPASDDAPPQVNSDENARPPAGRVQPTTNETAQPDAASQTSSTPPPANSPERVATRSRGSSSGVAPARRVKP